MVSLCVSTSLYVDDSANAKTLTVSEPPEWKRPPGYHQSMWLKSIPDNKNLTLIQAARTAHKWSIWRLLNTRGTTPLGPVAPSTG